ncbi:MAG TPA: hypothetical protein VF792_04375 [Ktedonobacterales bacterium]
MLEKLAAFAKTKAAIALLGVAVVGGGGGAVAVAATTGHLSTMGVNLDASHSDNEGDHTSVEGLLTGCTGSSVSVKDRDGKSWTFNVTSTTKFNGDVKGDAQGDSKAGASTEKPDATEAAGTETGDHSGSTTGDSSAKGTETGDHSGASTGDHSGTSTGDHSGSSTSKGSNSENAGSSTNADSKGDAASHKVTLAQICAAANINTRDVQVQGTKTSSGYDAVKVTLQGPGSAKNDGSSSNEGSTSHAGSSTGDSSEGGSSTAKP